MPIIMGKAVPFEVIDRLHGLGARIRAARQCRGWTIAETAAMAGINRNTLGALEQGKPGVAIGAYLATLWVMGLDRTVDGVADQSEDAHAKAFASALQPKRVRKPAAR